MLPTVQQILSKHLAALRDNRERAPSLVQGLHANASSAGACARQVGFRVAGLPASNPPDGDALFNFTVGDAIHDIIQGAVLAKIPDAEKEINGVIGGFITCRADLKYPADDGKTICCEIKSVSDFAYKQATGAKLKSNGRWNTKEQKGEGPKKEHLMQVGISAKSIDADYLCIVYARKTATRGEPVIAEWRFKVEDLEVEIQAEIARLKQIVETVKANRIPDREYQGEIIGNPKSVNFPCGYCSFKDACLELGAGEGEVK